MILFFKPTVSSISAHSTGKSPSIHHLVFCGVVCIESDGLTGTTVTEFRCVQQQYSKRSRDVFECLFYVRMSRPRGVLSDVYRQ